MENRNLFSSKIHLLFTLLTNGYLKDIRLFKAFLDVNLEEFIPKEILPQVRLYNDSPVVFFYDKEYHETVRTISAPHMISIMLQELKLKENDDLLILGAKSGYIACLAHNLAPNGKIFILEANPKIAKITSENLKKVKLDKNIQVIIQNPLLGYPKLLPWQKILVTGAIEQEYIYPLLVQLDPYEGVLFAPIGGDFIQVYTQIIRSGDNFYGKKHLQVRFTPLITKVELDNLMLTQDPKLINEKEVRESEKEGDILDFKKIVIDYSMKILEDVQLNPDKKQKKDNINSEHIVKVFLEHIDSAIDKLKQGKNDNQWSDSINNFEILFDILKKIKNNIKVDLDTLYNSVDQIKKKMNEIKRIKKDLQKAISDKYMEINKLKNELNEQINSKENRVTKIKNVLVEKTKEVDAFNLKIKTLENYEELKEIDVFQKKIKEEIYQLCKLLS